MSVIETKRLYLRALSEKDATSNYVNWLNNPEVNRYLETRHSVQSISSCKAFIRQCNEDESAHLYGVFLKDGERHIGNTKLGFINEQYARGELSLFIGDKTYWGKGLAGEVVQALTQYGFKKLGLERIEAGCYEENMASLRVFLKTGYTVEGFKRSHVVSSGSRSGCFMLGIIKGEFDQND
jgi:RimJ/RimL family protein N-acetyltransferase